MATPITDCGYPVRKTQADSPAAISAGPCQLLGFYVATTTAGTLVLSDGGTAISGTITPAAGRFHEFPANVGTSLTATIGGTALDVTFFIAAGH